MNLSREIFKAYDVRGVYPTQINEEVADAFGKAFGTRLLELKLKNVVIGRDDRESSFSLANSLAGGLISTGVNVVNTGITVQPAIHYFTFLDDFDAAINITASHNPGQFNGIKVDLKNAVPFYGSDLAQIYQDILNANFASGNGKYTEENFNQKYIDFISSKFSLKRKIKVVVYCGNGATSEIYPSILENIGAHVLPLRCYIDGASPKGIPDPETENFYPELIAEVLKIHAELGIGFDGDGDRVGEVDHKGRGYKADEIFLLFIKDVLNKKPGASIIYDVKCSALVEKYISELGGVPKMLKTGRSYFLQEMYNGNALLGTELSGHTYFKDDFLGFDDGIYTACRLLKIMDETGKNLNALMSEFPTTVSTPELKVTVEESKKFEIVKEIVKDLELRRDFLDINDTDGARVMVSHTGWFLIRASNTSPYLSIRAEGKDAQEVEKILKEIAKILTKHDLNSDILFI